MAFRAVLHHAGAFALNQLLRLGEPTEPQRSLPCPCGHQARYRELRSRRVWTALGAVEITRPWYLCPRCHQGQFPADQQLDIENPEFSPGVRRRQALVGQDASFDHGRKQMALLAGLEVTAKSIERVAESIGADIAQREQQQIDRAVQLDLPIVLGEPVPILYVQMDGTGVPVVNKETEGRKGKLDGLPAHTREVKLGCVFTPTGWDEEGFAVRDRASTTYTGAIENAEQFGKRLFVEAWNRGWSRAQKKVVIGDGAEWIWNIAKDHFPGAIQIVDLFHARQHLWELARLLFANDTKRRNQWIGLHQKRWLDKGGKGSPLRDAASSKLYCCVMTFQRCFSAAVASFVLVMGAAEYHCLPEDRRAATVAALSPLAPWEPAWDSAVACAGRTARHSRTAAGSATATAADCGRRSRESQPHRTT